MADNGDSSTTLKVEETIEGDFVDTDDYFFCKIGDSVPLTSSNDAVFDTVAVPSKPLVLSPLLGLIFTAHSSGFCVAKTKGVIDAAKEIKEEGSARCVQELSVVDVDVGRVSILSLSDDSSYVAAVVGTDIHFFQVDSLLSQVKKPFFSSSVESNHVKDMLWIKDAESYVVLTDTGNLHVGTLKKQLANVMSGVDAVERSVDGNFLALGQKNSVRILSSAFEEILQILLPLASLTGDDGDIKNFKVDSIRWVRTDSIVVGCVQQTEDGREEDYFLQVITSEEGALSHGTSKVTAVQFNDLFLGIVDDIVPFGRGPNLFMNYVENCEFAFVSNRKNTDQHVVLLSWLQGDNQVAVVNIERDSWLPRIEIQENGDDNLVLGACVDKASVYENVKVEVGVEQQRELRPHCLLVCLTLEGKLVMFNVASIAGSQCSNEDSPADNVETVPVISHSFLGEALSQSEVRVKQSGSDSDSVSHGLTTNKISATLDCVLTSKDPAIEKNVEFTAKLDENLRKEAVAGDDVTKDLKDDKTSKLFGYTERFPQEISTPFPLRDTPAQALVTEKWKIGSLDTSQEKNTANEKKGIEEKAGSGVPRSIWNPTGFSSYVGASGLSQTRPLFSSPSSTKSSVSGSPFTLTDHASAGSLLGNRSSHISDTPSISVGKSMNYIHEATTNSIASEKSPSDTGPQLYTREGVSSQNPVAQSMQPMKGNNQKFTFGQLNSELNLPKQFGNVQNMAKELDRLLGCIEGSGEFRDTCTAARGRSLEALEEGMQSLSERSSVWQSATEERLREIEVLLDKTVQVLARKTHMEGIVRQTTDEQYWELWNRQKLSSELDQKRQTVLNLSQDLVNRMIELEKHFNALELNNFGESSGASLHSPPIHSRSAASRYRQSLLTVHNATVSQLAAAQQLSDCLTKQMTVLSIKSPAKQMSIKKQVFETIGLAYPDDNTGSPNVGKVFDSPSNKLLLVAATHSASKRSHLSGRTSDLESSRRRRDSLDMNWTKYEAPKTTVKRMLVQNEEQNGSSLFSTVDKHSVSPCNLEGPVTAHRKVLGVQDKNGSKGTPKVNPDTLVTPAFKWAGGTSETAQLQAKHSSVSVIENIFSSSPLPSLSSVSSFMAPDSKKENTSTTVSGRESQIEVGDTGKSDNAVVDAKPSGSQWVLEKSTAQRNQPQAPSSLNANQRHVLSKNTELFKPSSSVQSVGKHDVNARSIVGSLGTPPMSSFSFSQFSNSAQTLPMAPVEPPSTTTVKMAKDVTKEVFQVPSSASLVSSTSALTDSFSMKGSLRVDLISQESSANTAKESLKLVPQAEALVKKTSSETNVATSSQASDKLAPSAEDISKSKSLTTSAASTELLKPFGISPTLTNSVTVLSDVVTNTPPEKQSTAFTKSPVSFPSTLNIASGKDTSDTAVTQEDEMEEEAPEINHAPDLSLGSLSGFGLGTAVNTTAPKSNPFGGPISSSSPSTPTSFSYTVPSGQLFHPASFSFQSPQISQQSHSPGLGASSGAFGSTTAPQQQPPAASGFGQPGQVGFGGGQQALGSVLGSFGQSRQIGAGLPGAGFGGSPSSSGFPNAPPTGGFAGASVNTGGFAGVSATSGGFAGASASSGGFAGIGATTSGFAAAASPSGGFGAAAYSGGGFGAAASGGGGFGAAASTGGFGGGGFATAGTAGGGFGAFNNQGTSGFSGFGAGSTGGRQPPSALFTQMRR